ncbi:MAG: hypothetical protein M3N52_13700 [Actinomycetota bacterium]|nr:hypothetical protein [Actinomycetota bacterium]
MLGSVTAAGSTIVADLEAGIGTLTRLSDGLDTIVVVVEPTSKSIEVGRRAADFVREKSLGRLVVVANRLTGDDDFERIRAAFSGYHVVPIPDDPAVAEADRQGAAPLDRTPDAPAMRALVDLAGQLVPARG